MTQNTSNTAADKKGGLFKKYLDNTFGEEGLRTDVKITLTNETIVKVIIMVVTSSVLGTAAHIFVKKLLS